MTTSYEATDRSCIQCGNPVEDYIGHLQASEMTACGECHEEVSENAPRSTIVHNVPRKDGNGGKK